MLIDILQKITDSLTRNELATILYNLIQPNCGHQRSKNTTPPYNELRQILDEQYTMTHIVNLKNASYTADEIIGLLGHLYQYSIISKLNMTNNLQVQPHVILGHGNDGNYIYIYDTFNVFDHLANIIYMNDFKYIMEPVQFVERPRFIDIVSNVLHINEMEKLFAHDKCDQYLAFQIMLQENNATCVTYTDNPSVSSGDTTASVLPQRRSFLQTGIRRSTDTNNADTTQKASTLITLPYLVGYFNYKLTLDNNFRL